MKQDLRLWQWSGFIFVSLLGTLLHFLYDWTGQSSLAALFSGINESTWEHMKLLYFPLLIFGLIQSRFFTNTMNFWCIKLTGLLAGLLLIPIVFYTYNGAFGKSPAWFNITIYFIAVTVVLVLERKWLQKEKSFNTPPNLCFFLFCFIGILFILFTFLPPSLPLFQDPISGNFGIDFKRKYIFF